MSLLAQSLQHKAVPPNVPVARNGVHYTLINGRLVGYVDNQRTYIDKGYSLNDIIYSIITLITDKIRVAPWGVYRVRDETAYKALRGIQRKQGWSSKDYMLASQLQHKALELVADPGKLGELMEWANDQEATPDFVANGAAWEMLTGNEYIWGRLLKAGANSGTPFDLQLLPAHDTNIFCTDEFPSRVIKYNLATYPATYYQPNEILHIKTWNPNHQGVRGAERYGVSPLKAALLRIQNNNSAVKASASSFENEGIKGILHMKATPGSVDGEVLLQEVARLKKTMTTEWVGPDQRGRIGLGGYDMGWIDVGLNAEEMQMIESQKWDLRMLCNIYGIQSQLLNDPDNKTYANQEEAELSLTTRAALPRLNKFRNNFNRKLVTDWGGKKGVVCDYDLNVYTELQQDTKEMVEWLTPLMDRGLPLNRVLELLNLEKIDDTYYDEPRVTIGMGQTLEEHNMNAVEEALNDPDEEEEL